MVWNIIPYPGYGILFHTRGNHLHAQARNGASPVAPGPVFFWRASEPGLRGSFLRSAGSWAPKKGRVRQFYRYCSAATFLASGGDTCPRSRVVVPTRQSPITFNIYVRVHHICLNILAPREYHLFIILHSYYLTEVYWVNKLLKSWAIFDRLHTIKNENNSLKWEKKIWVSQNY
jgi:hypothetical protein